MPLTDDDKKKYKELYLQTAKPYIADLEKIASLQQTDASALEVTHRAAHSLGSQSLMMEYNSIGKLSRLLEKILKTAIDGQFTIDEATKEAMVEAVAGIKSSVASIEKNDSEMDLEEQFGNLSTISKSTV
jgi:chemotaxis protein histidine kinase CheA